MVRLTTFRAVSAPPRSPSQLGPSPAPASERKMRAGSDGLPGRERGPVLSYAVYLRTAGCLGSASLPSGRRQVEHVNDEPTLVRRVGRARSAPEDAAVLTTVPPGDRYRAVSRGGGHSGNRLARAVFATARPPGWSFCGWGRIYPCESDPVPRRAGSGDVGTGGGGQRAVFQTQPACLPD